MDVSLFDFDLPQDRIALRPVEPREAARLLVVPHGEESPVEDRRIGDLPDLLRPDDVLVINDTRVIAAELHGTRCRDGNVAKISVNLLHRAAPDCWDVLMRPAKKVKVGEQVVFTRDGETCTAELVGKADAGVATLRFDASSDALDALLDRVGQMPLPPYIGTRRAQDAQDSDDYQTIFADRAGAVAAPTAGLHFTDDLLRALVQRGLTQERLTLHVGGGTFLPVKAATTEEHEMHAEWGEIRPDVAARLTTARAEGRRLVCIGTTALRLLESAAAPDGTIAPFLGETDIFITPGYSFRAADVLLTNFHLPRSTLFMLVSAFSGLERMRAAYAHSVEAGYRFYSYGDACLLECARPREKTRIADQ